MRERDENAYIRFFALWFAAGMTLGVLLLLAASHTGMKEGNSVRLFQAEAFFWKKNFRKGLLFLSSKGTVSTGICGTSLWIDGNRCVFCHCCRLGIWFSVWRLSLGCLSAERNGRSFILFSGSFSADFPLPCRVISDGCCVQPDGRDESPCRRHTEKGIFLLRRALLLCNDPASVGYSA